MNIEFNIEYRTNWGESVKVIGSTDELGKWDETKAVELITKDGIHWSSTIRFSENTDKVIHYNYCIYRDQEIIRKEWNTFPRKINIPQEKNKKYRIQDSWRNISDEQTYLSSAFTECFMPHKTDIGEDKRYAKSILIKAFSPRLGKDYALAISGNQKCIGEWDTQNALVLNNKNYPEWEIEIDASKIQYPLEYKFVLYNTKEQKIEEWEDNPNRIISNQQLAKNETLVISDRYVRFRLPQWKCAGVAVPIFSLRSNNSYGVGDFGDLIQLIDWAKATQQNVVQILPINDTTITKTWTDSYPYNSISIYAFHPMYLDINQLNPLKDKARNNYFQKQQQKINSYDAIDYEAVNNLKWEFIHEIFTQEGKKVLASKAFKAFFEQNEEWLKPYAAFSYLRDIYGTPNFREWPKYALFKSSEIDQLCNIKSKAYTEIATYYYVQYQLHVQLLAASEYARKNQIALKGDIPIGISRNSVEAWKEPHYFNMNGQAGAPPDDFSVNGQNWGFPTYNWEIMAKDNYSWWMKRFQKMSEYFDAYRIDHILGFFRIWEIPMHSVHGLLGQFSPSLPMSKEEIEGYGLYFNEDFFTKPYIHESFLHHMFGAHVDYVKNTFIRSTNQWEIYEMRPEFDTQRKVEAFFKDKKDENNNYIRDGLYALISNVLFVRDNKDASKYHPRISVQHDHIYNALSYSDKSAFNRLYDHYYYHRHNEFWRDQAMQKLPQLTQSTRMLVCGEDLGMIPDCVASVMQELRILSLEIQRMPKNPSYEFGNLGEYPHRSVCTISTHDMSTLRGWWEEEMDKTQRYYNFILQRFGEAPKQATSEICEDIIRRHLHSNSMLCVLALQDWFSIDEKWRKEEANSERINIPANPRHYWRYRMHITLEELIKADSLNQKIKQLIEETQRYITK
jgi:4-alpha-glucanotransferase